MAPPRQRPVSTTATSAGAGAVSAGASAAPTSAAAAADAVPDDSRSEASSTRERQGTTKGRKSAAATTSAPSTGSNATLKEGKAPAADQRMDESGTVESQVSVRPSSFFLDPTIHPDSHGTSSNRSEITDKLEHHALVRTPRIPLRI